MLERAREIGDRDRLPLFKTLPPPEADEPDGLGFKFIDLFAGIGGMRQALDRIGGICSYSVEWDKYSQKTYREWYGETPKGDITKIKPSGHSRPRYFGGGIPVPTVQHCRRLEEEESWPRARLRLRESGKPVLHTGNHHRREASADRSPREREEPEIT